MDKSIKTHLLISKFRFFNKTHCHKYEIKHIAMSLTYLGIQDLI